MSKDRVEAFSDGVLAVAITLLVLNLHADADSSVSLATQLGRQWPSFAAFVLSFFTVGVIWVNHHALFSLAARVDRRVLLYNLLLLMFVSTIPFTTSTLASYLRSGGANAHLAVLIYGASMEGMAVSFTLILRHLIHHRLLVHEVSAKEGGHAVRRFGLGSLVYPVIAVVGLLSPAAMLIMYAALTGFYIVEQTPILPSNGER